MIGKGARFIAFLSLAGWLASAPMGFLAAFAVWPAPASAATGRIWIESGGVSRSAILVQHRRLKQARRPVVIVLRSGKERRPHRRLFGLEEMARSSGPILLYPDPAAGHWSDAPGHEASRDQAFIRDLIGKLVSDGIADRRRIFIVGISSGGLTALRLACTESTMFAGAAAITASLPADLAVNCRPSRPLPLMMIAGTHDPLVPFLGGKANLPDSKLELLPVQATLGVFGKAAGCGEGHTTTVFPDRDPNDGTRVFFDKLNGCAAPVELVRIEGGGHAIPGHGNGAEAAIGPRNSDVDSAKLIWDFFRRLGG